MKRGGCIFGDGKTRGQKGELFIFKIQGRKNGGGGGSDNTSLLGQI